MTERHAPEPDPEEVLAFWLDECGPADWYAGSPELDARIRDRFETLWHRAVRGDLNRWRQHPRGTLAYLILTDQFPRNMFRDTAEAFASDHMALAAARWAIGAGHDCAVEGAARQFFYMPLEHCESLPAQEQAVRMFVMRFDSAETLLHARAHRDIIRRFGRFPFRNAALGRTSTAAEGAFLEEGGYGTVVRRLQAG